MTDIYGREKTNAEWLTDQAKALRERANPCAGETPITIMAGRFESAAQELSDMKTDADAMAPRIQAGDRSRDQVIEECAQTVESSNELWWKNTRVADNGGKPEQLGALPNYIASRIRALKTKPLS